MQQLNITGNHIDVTPALRDYVSAKIEKVVRHFDHITSIHVVLSVEKLEQKAEATLHVDSGANIHADAVDKDMYAAIDALADKVDRQVKKHKEKIQDHHK